MAKEELCDEGREDILRSVMLHAALHLKRYNPQMYRCFMEKRGLKSDEAFVYTFCHEYTDYIFKGEDTPESIRETALALVSCIEKYDTLCAGLWVKRRDVAKKLVGHTGEENKKAMWRVSQAKKEEWKCG